MARNQSNASKQRERRAQLLLQDRIARRHEQRIKALIADASNGMIDVYEVTGNVPDAVTLQGDIFTELKKLWAASIHTSGKRIVEAGQKSSKQTPQVKKNLSSMSEAFFDRLFINYITQVGGELIASDIAKATKEHLMGQVKLAAQAGIGIIETARMMRKAVGTVATYRAHRIARTETHAASNFASHETVKESGMEAKKEWIAANQPGRTRKTHAKANGQVVAMSEPFIVGNSKLMYAGDQSGRAEDVINCRCAVGYIIE